MSAAESIVAQASDLLRTYRLALNAHGAEIAELSDQGVADHTIARLYPYAAADWREGYARLTTAPPMPRTKMSPQRRTPPALDSTGWQDARRLAVSIDANSLYFDAAQRITYGHLRGKLSLDHDPPAHLELLVMLLHILATSQQMAAALEINVFVRYAEIILTQARALTEDPKFWAPPQPCSD